MTGPIDHRAAAKQMLEEAADSPPTTDPADVSLLLQFAQVHATLALSDPPPVELRVADAADVDLPTTVGLLELRQLVRDYLAARRVNDLSAAFAYLEQLADMVEEDES